MTRAGRVTAFIEAYCKAPEGQHVGKPMKLETEDELFALLMMRTPPPELRELTRDGLKPWVV